MTIKFLIEKEFKQFFRNSFLPRMIVAMPLMMMLVLPWAANQEVRDLQLCVVDHDHTPTSSRLVQKVASCGYFHLAASEPSYERGLECVERGEADLILEIPLHFERRIGRGEQPTIYIATNAVNGTKGTIGSSYLAQIVSSYGASLADRSPSQTKSVSLSSAVSLQYRFNPNLDYKVYMVPAMMMMLLTLLGGFLPALNIVGEKEAGTMEQMNVTPVGKFEFILSKLIPYWIMGVLVMSFCLLLAYLVYGLVPVGGYGTVYLFAAVYILVVSGFGLVISNVSDTMQQAVFVMYFFVMILLLMSGLLTPVGSMPDWAQNIAMFNPLKYYVTAMRAIFLKGSVMTDLLPELYALLTFALFFNTWAVLSYRKRG